MIHKRRVYHIKGEYVLKYRVLFSDCKENGDIVVHGLSKNSTIQIVQVDGVNPNGPICNKTITLRSDLATIPYSCTNSSKVITVSIIVQHICQYN
jgi:hypothetical protein